MRLVQQPVFLVGSIGKMTRNSKLESLANKATVALYALGIMLTLMGYVNQETKESNNNFINENSNLQN
ncbi:MAG: hypothetical protein QNJ72_05990 [Pleurocapsa sp. MO_226.B13]|nr:hypothetical protein [Pleurocapsa sp. MO_226.B13]